MADEVMTPVPTSDALRQAEILAMRQLSDNVAMLNRTVEKLDGRMGEVRDKVIQLEAQELKSAILEVKQEVSNAVRDLRHDHEARLEGVEKRAGALEIAHARLRGAWLPLATIGSALLAAGLAFLSELALRGMPHP